MDALKAAIEILGFCLSEIDPKNDYTLRYEFAVTGVLLSISEQVQATSVVNSALASIPEYRRLFCTAERDDNQCFTVRILS